MAAQPRRLAANDTHVCPLMPLGHLVESPRNGALLFFGYHVIDGDTVRVIRDRGDGLFDCHSVRLNKIDTPELRGKSLLEKEVAKRVRDVVECWLFNIEPALLRVSYHAPDKFGGRFLGDFFSADAPTATLSDFLLSAGMARRYEGGGKREPWSVEELSEIGRVALQMRDPEIKRKRWFSLTTTFASVRIALRDYEKTIGYEEEK